MNSAEPHQLQRPDAAARGPAPGWRFGLAGLLLLATMLNYMDRQTLANLAVRITNELALSQERYGDLELAFGWAFAAGSLCFGYLADRLPVRWLYPAVVVGWSAAGALTALADGFGPMLACRTLLGFFEAGHWPCALKTTQAALARRDRLLGNSILQSGGALGAILTPLVIRFIVGDDVSPGAWRPPFLLIGGAGAVWAVVWLAAMRSSDLEPCPTERDEPDGQDATVGAAGGAALTAGRRFAALVPMVICINITWHLLRAWLPKFLQQGRGATESESLFFTALYYAAADAGCIAAGAAGAWLARRGVDVHRSRLAIVAVCSALTALTVLVASLPRGAGMYAVLLVIGAGAMGLFPCYYSLAQEVSPRHLGKATGLLAAIGWLLASPLQKAFGRLVDRSGSFDLGIACAGLAPALALVFLVVLWPRPSEAPRS